MEALYIFSVIISFAVTCNCIMWHMEPNTQKCLREELQQNVPVTGEFEVSDAPGQRIDYVVSVQVDSLTGFQVLFFFFILQVRDSKGHILATREDISKGKFSFVTEIYDMYEICFISKVPQRK